MERSEILSTMGTLKLHGMKDPMSALRRSRRTP